MGEVIVDQVLLNPGPVLIEGAGAAWGGLWGDVTLLAVAMEVALDAAFAHVERLSGLLEGHSFVEDGIHDAFAEVGGVGHASACNNVTHYAPAITVVC